MIRYLVCLILLLNLAHAATAEPKLQQSFRSCSLITSELLTSLEFQRQGITLEELKKSLPEHSAKSFKHIEEIYQLVAQKGALKTYQTINKLYENCAKQAYETYGMPKADQSEFGFYYCSGENKIRFLILEAFDAKQSLADVRSKLPESHRSIADEIYQQIQKGNLTDAYEHSAVQLKSCLNETLGLSKEPAPASH